MFDWEYFAEAPIGPLRVATFRMARMSGILGILILVLSLLTAGPSFAGFDDAGRDSSADLSTTLDAVTTDRSRGRMDQTTGSKVCCHVACTHSLTIPDRCVVFLMLGRAAEGLPPVEYDPGSISLKRDPPVPRT